MGIHNDPFQHDKEFDDMRRATLARWELQGMNAEQIVNGYREQIVANLFKAGICLIPSDHLQDHQIVVSRAVYNKAKEKGGL